MNSWNCIRLGDVCCVNTEAYSEKERWDYVHYLDTGNITKNCIDEIQYIDLMKEKLPSRARRKVKYNSILYSTVRPNQCHYGIVKEQSSNFLVSTGFSVIDVIDERVDADFLYYYLTMNAVTEKMHAIAEQSTSAYPAIKSSDIEDLELKLPDILTQKRIASFLMSLEHKITNNTKLNKNLEEQAQAIFVHLFSDHPYHLGTLSQIADVIMGQSPRGESYNETKSGALFFQGRADFGFRFPTPRLYTTEPKRMAQAGDVLLSVRAPVGDLNIALEPCCIGRGIAAIRSIDGHPSFLFYCLLSQKDQFDVFNGEGTVFGSINSNALKSMEVRIPPKKLLDHFEEMVAPIDTVIRVTSEEILYLTALRDALLPRLMSGGLDVSSIEL